MFMVVSKKNVSLQITSCKIHNNHFVKFTSQKVSKDIIKIVAQL